MLERTSVDGNCHHFAFLLRPHFQKMVVKCKLIPPVKQPLVGMFKNIFLMSIIFCQSFLAFFFVFYS
ncbi:unnamed protein product [Meloidogyne enterolobii]|uniref:Uncharacterized protein n=1 Tax=Meloidogyne enterolobii TaxID=390850 RepID=A0ACB1A3L6_MELEN